MPRRDFDIDIRGLDYIGDATTVKASKVVYALDTALREYKDARLELESMWAEYYANYLTTSQSARANITTASRKVGIEKTWRHQVKAPIGFQAVETLVAYFMGAFFPNERWFNVVPESPIQDPNFQEIVELNRKYLSSKLDLAMFDEHTEVAIRECCIAGTSALMFPWHTDNVEFTPLSPFEFYLDPENPKPNQANLIRPYSLKSPEVINYIESGLFNLVTKQDYIDSVRETYRSHELDDVLYQNIQYYLGMQSHHKVHNDRVLLHEFWGDLYLNEENVILKNIRATWSSDKVIFNLDTNPYQRKPFKILTYLELGKSPYGIGALQAVSSQIFYRDVLTSRHADNAAISSDSVLLYRQDAVVDPDDLVIRPGAKIPVTDLNGLQPLQMNYQGTISLQEMALADQMVDRAIGTGAFIGVDRGRNADRVTAEEVAAQREAGGKRLSSIYSHLSRTFLVPLLQDFHYYCQNFESNTTVVAYGNVYVGIEPEAIQFPMKVVALGATNVADREYNLRQLLQWMEIVGNNPQLAQLVNWPSVLQQLTSMMVPHLADLLTQQQQPTQPEGQGNVMSQLEDAIAFSEGQAGVRALRGQQQAGTMANIAADQVQQLQPTRG